jgi:hypothetical protein
MYQVFLQSNISRFYHSHYDGFLGVEPIDLIIGWLR